MSGERLAIAADQAQLLHLLKGVDANPGLFSSALVELRKVWLAGYLPKQASWDRPERIRRCRALSVVTKTFTLNSGTPEPPAYMQLYLSTITHGFYSKTHGFYPTRPERGNPHPPFPGSALRTRCGGSSPIPGRPCRH